MDERTLHMIGNAHLDPVWLWQWQEGFQAAKATFRSALDRMAEDADFTFTSSSAAVYEWIEHNEPEMFEEIRRRVAEGRWEICGGWWLQPDCNIPSGESFVRHSLYGQRYFQEKLGVMATVGYNVDSFGHNATLPQILRKSGMDSYVFLRPEPHEKELPGWVFWWEAPDGSRVLTYRIPFGYTAWDAVLEERIRRVAAEIQPPLTSLMLFYGVGNHGGGPTKRNLATIHAMQEDPALPRLLFSTPSRYFDKVRQEDLPLPVVRDELQHHASGCYAAHSGIKRMNRRAENLLLAAEAFSSVAARLTGQPYPADLDRAWKDVLFNQFHDIMGGTSLEVAYDDARDLHGEALTIAGRALNNAIQSLSWRVGIDAEDGMMPIAVFNPHAWPVTANVEMEFGRMPESPTLLDDGGKAIPFQTVRSHASAIGRHRLSFVASVPALGWRVYRMANRPDFPVPNSTPKDDYVLENDRFWLEIDLATGFIARLTEKRLGVDIISGGGAKPVVIRDPSDTWSHGITRFPDEKGTFTVWRIRRMEHGPVKSVLRVESFWGDSRLTQDFTLVGGLDRILVDVTVDWHGRHEMLKLRFPVAVENPTATFEIPYGHLVRPASGDEEPGQGWVDVTGRTSSGKVCGLSVLNDGKYSFDVSGSDIGLTVLRSPAYAHHDPFVLKPDGDCTFTDQGVQRFTYALLPHAGDWREAGTVRAAAELNQPLIALMESGHPGPLPHRVSCASVDAENVNVTVLKKSEDGDDLIVRAIESFGRPVTAMIDLPAWGRSITADFGPCEIKTFRLPADPAQEAYETDLLERHLPGNLP